jgi:hypothetical protein
VTLGTSDAAITASAVPSNHTYQARVWVTNEDSVDRTFRIRHAFADAGAATDQYKAYDAVVKANDFVVLPIFIVNPTDKLYGLASVASKVAVQVDILDMS